MKHWNVLQYIPDLSILNSVNKLVLKIIIRDITNQIKKKKLTRETFSNLIFTVILKLYENHFYHLDGSKSQYKTL